MQAIVFNITGSDFNRSMEATALRAAYLLGARPVIAGGTGYDIYFTRNMKGLSSLQKLRFLSGFHKKEPETHAIFNDMYDKMKEVHHVKPKTKEQRAARKAMEESVDKCFVKMVNDMQEIVDGFGFGAIRELHDKVFGYFPMNLNPEKADFNYEITASDLMQLVVVENDDAALGGIYNSPELFFFGDEFLSEAYGKPPIFSVMDKEAENKASVYLDRCFTFPAINELSANELQTVRKALNIQSAAFCEAVDEWCYQCYDNEAETNRMAFFRNSVLPAAGLLQQLIMDNETLAQYRQQNSYLPDIDVWVGELPVLQIWQYYRDFKVLQDETWHKLKQVEEEPGFKHQRWPVIMIQTRETKTTSPLEASGDEMQDILPVKKYLQID